MFGNIKQNWGEFKNLWGNALEKGYSKFSPSAVARENTDKTIEANKQLAEYQYQKDIEMFDKANAYNSPEEQMKRLKASGLNPNLIYGSGASGASGNTATALPKYNAPRVDYNYLPTAEIPNIISMFQDYNIKSQQLDNMKATNEAIKKETTLKGIMGEMKGGELTWLNRRNYTDLGNGKVDISPTHQHQLLEYSLESRNLQNRSTQMQMNKMFQDTQFMRTQNEYYVEKMVAGWLGNAAKLIMPRGVNRTNRK
ncbi:MAG: DNA pilot protein [Microviridae sp.]|nr:MAG: DNA pilot protein [Microviridae sp.]